MAVPFNSVVGFNSTLQVNYQHTTARTSTVRSVYLTSSSVVGGRLSPKKCIKIGSCLLAANGDRVVTESSNTASSNTDSSYSKDGSSSVNLPTLETSNRDDGNQTKAADGSGSQLVEGIQPKASDGSEPQLTELPNRPTASKSEQDPSANQKPVLKRSPLTAREKLRAARVLSRYTEPKASKPAKGSKLLDVLRESDKGKRRSGLPEAPTNLFDDSKRGMPKPGWTFEFPGGVDVFLVVVSFVLISTIMFATTFIVWKVGAIHFNEY